MSFRNMIIAVALCADLFAMPGMAEPSAMCRAHGQAALVAWSQGHYDSVSKEFDPAVASLTSPQQLKAGWAQLQAVAGSFRKLGDLQPRSMAGREVLVAEMDFSGKSMAAVVACDAQDRIVTFHVVPASALPAAGSQAETLDPAIGTSRSVQVPSPSGPLPGTLVIPRAKGPFPAVLLVAGSGPSDRDESVGPNKPLRDVADGLAAAGIASFRYDKRTYVYGAAMAGKAMTVDDEVTDDALAALRVLARQPSIDPHRLYVLGHSLGAMMAPRIGQRDLQLAGIIMLAAPVTLGPDDIVRQLRYIAQLQGTPSAELDRRLASLTRACNTSVLAGSAHASAGNCFHAPDSYWLSTRDYDPVATAKQLHQPMLILQGDGDYQVTPQHDFSRWQAAFAHDSRVTLIAYPGLSHLFMPAGHPPSPADYAKPAHMDARVIRDIAQWIKLQPPSS
ncbi:alpha/beta fold hydrolase [Dyella jejuensis]|uniref:Alpha/beta fold hydrolase n=1 Tax=Dyella jejuensis TaxID=1432009 RepID=A0ABW8JH88_9GAMM